MGKCFTQHLLPGERKLAKKKNKEVDDHDLHELLGGKEIKSTKDFISTGSTLLDYAIANRRNGGIPVGRITEISGPEASGKSLIAYHIMANTQRRGGIAIYIDMERAADETFMKRMGVDAKKLICPKPPKSIEAVFEYIENTIKVVKTRFPNKEKQVTIVWDSVAATSAEETIEATYDGGRLTPEARAMSKCLKKAIDIFEEGYVTLVCVNQLRTKIGVTFGDPTVTPHGKSLPFYASVRIKLASIGKVKEGTGKFGRVIGVNTKATVAKNRMGPPHRTSNFPIYFDWGINDEASFIDFLKDHEVIKQGGSWATLMLDDEEHKYQKVSGWEKTLKLPGVKERILNILEDKLVIKFDERPSDVVFEGDAITS